MPEGGGWPLALNADRGREGDCPLGRNAEGGFDIVAPLGATPVGIDGSLDIDHLCSLIVV